jgi:sterol 3beta-glucosyltransferase
MNIVITTFGVRGDIQPYLALAVGLQAAGHRVTLATSGDFTDWIQAYGVNPHPVPFSMQALMQQPEVQAALRGRNILRQMGLFREAMRQVGTVAEALWPAMQAADCVIQSPTSTGALETAHARGIPVALASPVPFAATRAYPSFFLGPLRVSLGAGYNGLTHALTHRMLWSMMGGPMSGPLRKQLGLKPWRSFGGLLAHARRLGVPVLYGYSGHVVPRPADWDDSQRLTGYWFLDPLPGWQPPADLLRFLDAGPPPIYVGFGSMSQGNAERRTRLALRALELTGQRGVLLTGWGGLRPEGALPNVCCVDDVPHAWLFPQMRAVVHHGGAGTTAAGLRAGVPGILTPYAGDQFAWAERVTRLGAGLSAGPAGALTAEKLAQAIEAAVNDAALRGRAAALGEKIRAEDGVGAAVEIIERHAAEWRAPGR